MKYAVLDWDYTIRSGYTMFSLIDFLCKTSALPLSVQENVEQWTAKYRAKMITHDQYAEYACIEFAQGIRGYSTSFLSDSIQRYMPLDRASLFSFSEALFKFLHLNDIAPIIISGAPICVLENYKKEFHIMEIYGFDLDQKDGLFTGNVKSNYGFHKERILSEIISIYGEPPYMGFGDSSSDYPLLQQSTHGFYVCKSAYNAIPESFVKILPTMSESSLISILSKCTSAK